MSIRYPEELRRQVCEEHRLGRSVRELAEDYGPSEMTIRHWIKIHTEQGTSSSGDEELHRLRREVRELKEDNAILKKAAAWFAREDIGRGRK